MSTLAELRQCCLCGEEDRHFLRDGDELVCFDCWQSGSSASPYQDLRECSHCGIVHRKFTSSHIGLVCDLCNHGQNCNHQVCDTCGKVADNWYVSRSSKLFCRACWRLEVLR